MIVAWEPLVSPSSEGGGTGATAEEVAEAVWDKVMADHEIEGTFGAYVQSLMESGEMTVDDIATAVWNRQLYKHNVSGTFGTLMKRIFKFILIGLK